MSHPPRNHPAERLKIILGLKPAGRNDRLFAELDSSYTHIFQKCGLVPCILRMTLARSFAENVPQANEEGCRQLLGITVEELELGLGDLSSVINILYLPALQNRVLCKRNMRRCSTAGLHLEIIK